MSAEREVAPGQAFDLTEQPPLRGRYVTLEPMTESRASSFYKSSGMPHNPELWRYMRTDMPKSEAECWAFWERIQSRPDFFVYAITVNAQMSDTATTKDPETVGAIGYLDVNTSDRTVEIGFVIFTPKLQRSKAGTEAHYLILRNVFESREPHHGLPYRRAWWKCNALNQASRRAAERQGYVYEGRLRNHMISQGRSRDSEILSIIEDEWPLVKSAFEEWFKDANFDAQGQQIKTLTQIRQALSDS